MEMMIRELAFFAKYLVMRWKYRSRIWFRGVPAIYAFKGSQIQFNIAVGGKNQYLLTPAEQYDWSVATGNNRGEVWRVD